MVHLRLNETESKPNPHINFITALPSVPDIQEQSLHLLRALAAQVKPVMKRHGFEINSLEEYEYNAVFAGRNWNNGEIVELVLRRQGGDIYPISWLMSTFCHELAHIKHMNHGPAFQSLWKQLREEVRQLQNRGYYGDGYWSSGQRLADSARIPGDGIDTGEFPEYMCGGAQQRSRPTARRRRTRGTRGAPKEVTPSLHSGRQTEKKRKAGGRVTSKYAFVGEGISLGGSTSGSTKGKRAASNRAREERALAVEKRLQATSQANPSASRTKEESPEESEEEYETTNETDAERRAALVKSQGKDNEIKHLGSGMSWQSFESDFNFVSNSQTRTNAPSPPASASGRTNAPGSDMLGLGNIAKAEVDIRKKEAQGLDPVRGKGRILGKKPHERSPIPRPPGDGWSCTVCTL